MALTEKQQYWANHLQQADASNGSMADYARSQGLSPKALYQWRGILRQRSAGNAGATPAFAEVVAAAGPDLTAPSLTLTLGGAQLEFGSLPDESWLARLIIAHG